MKLKLAIIFGIIIWIFTFILTSIFNPIFTNHVPHVNIVIPLTMIIVTGFFGILYIRTIESNEVVEGFLAGAIFVIVDIILDYLFFILLGVKSAMVEDYTLHMISTIVVTLLITTFLGYLAQMTIDLK